MYELMSFEGNDVEVLVIENEPHFNPYHVGACLDLTPETVRGHMAKMGSKQAVLLKNSDVCLTNIRKFNNAGEKFLTESGVYKLVFKSRKPSAERFTDWLADVVLPTIRKTGGFVNNEDLFIDTYFAHLDEHAKLAFRASLANIRKLNQKVENLSEQVDDLEACLNESLKFYTVAKYNTTYKMGWNLAECQQIGRRLSRYCQLNSIDIRICKTNDERFDKVNSYPLTAWEALFGESA